MTWQFVILQHDMPAGSPRQTHWDFMIEVPGALRTWALDQPPRPNATINAAALADHRLHYLEYEGPVSGERGTVRQWDRGTYEWIVENDARECVIEIRGSRLQGRVCLKRTDDDQRWTFTLAGATTAT